MRNRHNHQCARYRRKLTLLYSPCSRGCRARAPSLRTICSKACGTPCTVCTPGALELASDAVGTQDNSRTVEACRRTECDSLMCGSTMSPNEEPRSCTLHTGIANHFSHLRVAKAGLIVHGSWRRKRPSEEARWRSETARLNQVTHASKNRWEGVYIVSNQTQRAQRLAARPETDLKAYGEATESQSLLSTR